MYRPVSVLKQLQDLLIVAYRSGDFDIFEIRDTQLWHRETCKQNEHESEIMNINVRGDFCCTTGADNCVKVWQIKPYKRLLKAIIFKVTVAMTATFLNSDLDLVIGHENFISVIKASTYMPYFKEASDDEQFLEKLTRCDDKYMQKLAKLDQRLRSNVVPDLEIIKKSTFAVQRKDSSRIELEPLKTVKVIKENAV